jgi:RNA polymerase sigma-70 factor (ECF subfamily)
MSAAETPLSLLERLRGPSDEAAWNRLVDLYTPFVERWLSAARVPQQDAADLAQDVMATLVRELPRFEHAGRAGAFRRWLKTIVVHRSLGYWRNRSSRGSAVEQQMAGEIMSQLEDPRGDLAARWDAEHDEFVLRRLMELVEPEFTVSTWRAFWGLVFERRSAAAVAGELGISPNAALIAKSRVLQRLRHEAEGLVDDQAG